MASKYKVSRKEDRTVDGIIFDSKSEANRFIELKHLVNAGEIRDLVLQPEFKVEIKGVHFCKYTADFGYTDVKTGKRIIEDVKSPATAKDPAFRLRKKAAEIYHDISVYQHLIGWTANKLTKRRKKSRVKK